MNENGNETFIASPDMAAEGPEEAREQVEAIDAPETAIETPEQFESYRAETVESFDAETEEAIRAGESRIESSVRSLGGTEADVEEGKSMLAPIFGKIAQLKSGFRTAAFALGTFASMEQGGQAQNPAELMQEASAAAQVEVQQKPAESAAGQGTEQKPIPTPTQESGRSRPEIRKDNPQRDGYKDYDSYRKYVEDMRDPAAEQKNFDEREKWKRLGDEYEERAEEAVRRKFPEDLRKEWLRLASMARRFATEDEYNDPRKKYEEARSISPQGFEMRARIVNEAFKNADKEREWMADVAHSEAYEKKATEYERLSPEEIERRRRISTDKDVHIEDPFHKMDITTQSGAYIHENTQSEFGRKPGSYTVTSWDEAEGRPVALHELEHAITDSNNRMSQYAERLYSESYAGPDRSTEEGVYNSKATELDARKRVFEYDLEQNGIWKYGQEFTSEHLQRALKLESEGKLSQDSKEFLRFIKHENIPKIMNTIAQTNGSEIPTDA